MLTPLPPTRLALRASLFWLASSRARAHGAGLFETVEPKAEFERSARKSYVVIREHRARERLNGTVSTRASKCRKINTADATGKCLKECLGERVR